MSASLSHPTAAHATPARPLRLGVASGVGGSTVQWLLKRNCSMTPRQMLLSYGLLCALTLGIGGFFWWQGALLVLPFAWLEVVAVGAALIVYSRHATNRESIRLDPGSLTVERLSGRQVERAEFVPGWVRVEPTHGERSLIELSSRGQRITVGRFVAPELRRQLADELRWALRRQPGSN